LCFVFPGIANGSNNFSADSNCVAVWRFEDSPGFTADSKGGNTLTNDGTDEESTLIKEGSQSALFVLANTDDMSITDDDLDAGFPWRYEDGAGMSKSFSVCLWMRVVTLPGDDRYMIAKYHTSGDLRVWAINIDYTNNKVRFIAGHTAGTLYEEKFFGTACVTGRWYHVGVTYNSTTYAYRIRIWDDTAGALLGADATGNFSQAIDPRDVGFTIGSRWHNAATYFSGYLDEVVVFKDVLTADEIDQIRNGTYGATGLSIPVAMHHYMHH
jgi:hypothetical protein